MVADAKGSDNTTYCFNNTTGVEKTKSTGSIVSGGVPNIVVVFHI